MCGQRDSVRVCVRVRVCVCIHTKEKVREKKRARARARVCMCMQARACIRFSLSHFGSLHVVLYLSLLVSLPLALITFQHITFPDERPASLLHHTTCFPFLWQTSLSNHMTRCNTLQHIATHCNTLQHPYNTMVCIWPLTTPNTTLQHTTTHDTQQHTITSPDRRPASLPHHMTHCNTLQHTATRCHTRPHAATPCHTLQHSITQGV